MHDPHYLPPPSGQPPEVDVDVELEQACEFVKNDVREAIRLLAQAREGWVSVHPDIEPDELDMVLFALREVKEWGGC